MTTPLIRYDRLQFKNREIILDRAFVQYLKQNHLSISTRANPNAHPDVLTSCKQADGKQKYIGKLYNVLAQYYGKEFIGWRSENINDFRMRNIEMQ